MPMFVHSHPIVFAFTIIQRQDFVFEQNSTVERKQKRENRIQQLCWKYMKCVWMGNVTDWKKELIDILVGLYKMKTTLPFNSTSFSKFKQYLLQILQLPPTKNVLSNLSFLERGHVLRRGSYSSTQYYGSTQLIPGAVL